MGGTAWVVSDYYGEMRRHAVKKPQPPVSGVNESNREPSPGR
jgi:hypothetical protein